MIFIDKLMTDHDVLVNYVAMKLHFRYDKGNYHEYYQYVKDRMDLGKRSDRQFFQRLRRRFPRSGVWCEFLLSNFLFNPEYWIGDLGCIDCLERHQHREKRIQSLSYVFQNDMKKIITTWDVDAFKTMFRHGDEMEHPPIITLLKQNDICVETVVLLNKWLNFIPELDRVYVDDRRWTMISQRIMKYSYFITKTESDVKNMVKQFKESLV